MMEDDEVKKSIHSGLKTLCFALGKIDDGEFEGNFGLGDSLESELELSDSSQIEFVEPKPPTMKMNQFGFSKVQPAVLTSMNNRVGRQKLMHYETGIKKGCQGEKQSDNRKHFSEAIK